MLVQSTEEEESRRTKRESAVSLYKARTTGSEGDGTKKQGLEREERGWKRRWKEEDDGPRDKERTPEKEK